MADDKIAWGLVREFMRQHCGVVLGDDQGYLLNSRLGEVAKVHGGLSVPDFVVRACKAGSKDPATKALVDAMTTHESYFFRDAPFWQGFEDIVIPTFVKKKSQSLRVWSTACSHGQEVYTLLIAIAEKWPELLPNTTVFATDISEAAIARGAAGIYTSLEVNRGLSATLLLRYFEKAESGYQVKKVLRDRVKWQVHNLLDSAPDGQTFDIALCRNVLIYFNEGDKKTVLNHIFKAVDDKGAIGLGTSEICSNGLITAGWYIPTPPVKA